MDFKNIVIISKDIKIILHNAYYFKFYDLFMESNLTLMLECTICKDIMDDAVECNNCNVLACEGCFNKWLKLDKGCHNCRKKFRHYKLNKPIR